MGLSSSEAARRIGRATNTIINLEAGRTADPAISGVVAMARLYGVSLDWLLDDSQAWPPPPSVAEQVGRAVMAHGGGGAELDRDGRELLAAWLQLGADGRARLVGFALGLAAGGTATAAGAGADLEAGLAKLRRARQQLDAGTGPQSHSGAGRRKAGPR